MAWYAAATSRVEPMLAPASSPACQSPKRDMARRPRVWRLVPYWRSQRKASKATISAEVPPLHFGASRRTPVTHSLRSSPKRFGASCTSLE